MAKEIWLPAFVNFLNVVVTIIIVWGLLRGAYEAIQNKIECARLRVADSILHALSIVTAITVLRTIALQTYDEILTFAAIFILRLFLKTAFQWEKKVLQTNRARGLSELSLSEMR